MPSLLIKNLLGVLSSACLFRRYDAALDEGFEESYQAYLVRQKLRKQTADTAIRKRKRLGAGGELDEAEEQEGMNADEVLAMPMEEEEVRNDWCTIAPLLCVCVYVSVLSPGSQSTLLVAVNPVD